MNMAFNNVLRLWDHTYALQDFGTIFPEFNPGNFLYHIYFMWNINFGLYIYSPNNLEDQVFDFRITNWSIEFH